MSVVPGSPSRVEATASMWRRCSGQCEQAAGDLRGGGLEDWAGRAAPLYEARRRQCEGDLSTTGEKLLAGAQALETFADRLEAAQRAAAWAETDKAEAAFRLRDANLRSAADPTDLGAAEAIVRATSDVAHAQGRVDQAADEAEQAANEAALRLYTIIGEPAAYYSSIVQQNFPFSMDPVPNVRVTQAMADDRLVPGGISQNGIGDCWLLASFSAAMETPAGRQSLREGVRWDEDLGGYQVRLYDDGQAVWVPVTHVFPAGVAATSGGGYGLVSLYEAAVYEHYGHDYLWGNTASEGIANVTDDSTRNYSRVDLGPVQAHISDDAVQSGGSVDGTASVAATRGDYGGEDYTEVRATPDPTSYQSSAEVQIRARHAYEVVDIKDGMIGLRNPWGLGNSADEAAQNSAGVFYISQSDFDRAFQTQTHPEDTGPW